MFRCLVDRSDLSPSESCAWVYKMIDTYRAARGIDLLKAFTTQ